MVKHLYLTGDHPDESSTHLTPCGITHYYLFLITERNSKRIFAFMKNGKEHSASVRRQLLQGSAHPEGGPAGSPAGTCLAPWQQTPQL